MNFQLGPLIGEAQAAYRSRAVRGSGLVLVWAHETSMQDTGNDESL
jgi:hypothetical protein